MKRNNKNRYLITFTDGYSCPYSTYLTHCCYSRLQIVNMFRLNLRLGKIISIQEIPDEHIESVVGSVDTK